MLAVLFRGVVLEDCKIEWTSSFLRYKYTQETICKTETRGPCKTETDHSLLLGSLTDAIVHAFAFLVETMNRMSINVSRTRKGGEARTKGSPREGSVKQEP